MNLIKMAKLQNKSNELQDKSNELQNGINDVHYAFTKKIADTVIEHGKTNVELNEKINILIKEIQKLSSRVIKLEFEDDHEKKSIGGTTDE
jgi:X-X-X-Leu-X-X-Gly heptad repeat protein